MDSFAQGQPFDPAAGFTAGEMHNMGEKWERCKTYPALAGQTYPAVAGEIQIQGLQGPPPGITHTRTHTNLSRPP